jgi:malonyl-CoA/methylmalonyl-CoA synthetase
MIEHNLFSVLRAAYPSDLNATAVETDVGMKYSWKNLDNTSAKIANLFHKLGVQPGDRVAVQVEKSVEALMLYLAALRAGLVFLPLNTAYQSAEIEYFIGNAEPSVVVCSPSHFARVNEIARAAGTGHVFTLDEDGTGTLLAAAHDQSEDQTPVTRSENDMAAILYTSGTTGRSKGAMLTHGNLRSNALMLKEYWQWQPGRDVLIHALPIFHVHGLFVAINGALISGSKMLWMSKFNAKRAIAWMERATVFMGVPTLYVRMLAEPSLTQETCRHMRLFVAGSAPLLVETFNDWLRQTGHTILERYGMSETLMLTSNPYIADSRFENQAERRGGTVGFPLPGVQLRVRGDDEQDLPVGEIGSIQVKGPNVFKGYWRMPEMTAEEFTSDGYFKTGDVGKVDQQGYVTIVGRSKDLIISGGYNVYPAEIEGYINEISDVVESALIGVPHPDFGEVGVAVVIAKPGATLTPEFIIAELKQKLANFKIPKKCYLVSELPRNTMGKVQKNVLREAHKRLFMTA